MCSLATTCWAGRITSFLPTKGVGLGGWDCETVRGCRSYWYVRLQKQLLSPPPRRLGLWEGVDHTDHTDEIVSILRWWKWTRQEQCWHISVVNEHVHLQPTYMKTLYSIAASLFEYNWLTWQIATVSDDNIQITLLILRRGAFST